VLLQVVAFARDVGRDFNATGQANTSHLAKRRIGLLWGGGVDTGTDAAALRGALECGRLLLAELCCTTLADELLNGGHNKSWRS